MEECWIRPDVIEANRNTDHEIKDDNLLGYDVISISDKETEAIWRDMVRSDAEEAKRNTTNYAMLAVERLKKKRGIM